MWPKKFASPFEKEKNVSAETFLPKLFLTKNLSGNLFQKLTSEIKFWERE
jgi:hypothetical protein